MKYGLRLIAYIVIAVALYFAWGYYKDIAGQIKSESRQHAPEPDESPVIITVDAQGRITLDGDPVPLDNLAALLQAMQIRSVTVNTPKDLPMEQLEPVVQAIRNARVSNITLGVSREEPQ